MAPVTNRCESSRREKVDYSDNRWRRLFCAFCVRGPRLFGDICSRWLRSNVAQIWKQNRPNTRNFWLSKRFRKVDGKPEVSSIEIVFAKQKNKMATVKGLLCKLRESVAKNDRKRGRCFGKTLANLDPLGVKVHASHLACDDILGKTSEARMTKGQQMSVGRRPTLPTLHNNTSSAAKKISSRLPAA